MRLQVLSSRTIGSDIVQDDPPNATDSHGRFLSFRHPQASSDEKDLSHETVSPNLTMDAHTVSLSTDD